jgi:hypothetical protein
MHHMGDLLCRTRSRWHGPSCLLRRSFHSPSRTETSPESGGFRFRPRSVASNETAREVSGGGFVPAGALRERSRQERPIAALRARYPLFGEWVVTTADAVRPSPRAGSLVQQIRLRPDAGHPQSIACGTCSEARRRHHAMPPPVAPVPPLLAYGAGADAVTNRLARRSQRR